MLHNLKDVRWLRNEAIEMPVCKISMGLGKQKFDK